MSCCFDGEAADAWERLDLDPIELLIDESHFAVSLHKCAKCGQRYVKVFCERIDWVGGNDPQAWVVAPVSTEEAEALQKDPNPGRLGPRKWLDRYFPSEGPPEVVWRAGPVVLMPHD